MLSTSIELQQYIPHLIYGGAGFLGLTSLGIAIYKGIRYCADTSIVRKELDNNPETIRAKSEAEQQRAQTMEKLLSDPVYQKFLDRREIIAKEKLRDSDIFTPSANELRAHIDSIVGRKLGF